MSRRNSIVIAAFAGLSVLIAAPFVGHMLITPSDLLEGDANVRMIFWTLRLPRVLLAWSCGASLAVCGMIFQALFNNPLADPAMLGVSGGASFGAALCIHMGWSFSFLWMSGTSLCAFAGAVSCVAALCALSRMRPDPRGTALLLSGVAFSFLFSSMVMITQFLGSYSDSFRMIRWTLGGIHASGLAEGLRLLPAMALAVTSALMFSRELDLMTFGAETAAARGVSVVRTRTVLFVIASLCVSACVSMCGPVAFIGLMAPHIARSLSGPKHTGLTLSSSFVGGGFLALCDTASRTVLAPLDLPVGIITSFLGALFFLYLLKNRQSR